MDAAQIEKVAVENAIRFEAKKDGLRQRQSGDWVLSLVIQAEDMDQHIAAAAMGTRYHASLIQKNDDETPTDHKAKDRDKWRELGAAKQSGIRCNDPLFWAFLREGEYHYANVHNAESAACAVREICNVLTRTEFDKPGNDGKFLWLSLDNKFQAWKAREHG